MAATAHCGCRPKFSLTVDKNPLFGCPSGCCFECFRFMSHHSQFQFSVAAVAMEESNKKQSLDRNLFPPQRKKLSEGLTMGPVHRAEEEKGGI